MGAGLGGANGAKPHTPFLDAHIVIRAWDGEMEGWGAMASPAPICGL